MATSICQVLTNIHINLFLIRSDDADAYKSHKKLFELEIQVER